MTIGLVLNSTPGYSETFFHNKINSLQAKGCRVIVFARKANEVPSSWEVVAPLMMPGNKAGRTLMLVLGLLRLFVTSPKAVRRFVSLERANGRSWKTVIENLYINGHILTSRVDWLHFGFATTALRSENVAKAIGAKMAVSIRGYDIAVYPLKNPGCYDLLWKRVDELHTISDDLLELARKAGFGGNAVTKITPAIDYNKFAVTSTMPFSTNILTVARLNWKKGITYALHAIKILKDRNVDVRYTIVGDGDEKDSLVFMIHQLGLSDVVDLKGKVSAEEMSAVYRENSIYLQPSVQEGFCNAVLEAQASGLLCIVSDAEGLPENVINNVSGWVVPKRDPEAIANKVLDIIGMKDVEKKRVVTEAQQRVQQHFNLEKQTLEFLEFYS